MEEWLHETNERNKASKQENQPTTNPTLSTNYKNVHVQGNLCRPEISLLTSSLSFLARASYYQVGIRKQQSIKTMENVLNLWSECPCSGLLLLLLLIVSPSTGSQEKNLHKLCFFFCSSTFRKQHKHSLTNTISFGIRSHLKSVRVLIPTTLGALFVKPRVRETVS